MNSRQPFFRQALVIGIISVVAVSCVPSNSADLVQVDSAELPTLEVFRSATCGCCHKWVEHVEAAGFKVTETIVEDINAVKAERGVPQALASCHTTIADGYIIEGHIPAEDVARLLTEKSDVAGIAVPGMPIGSPGMEVGNEVEPYAVLSFGDGGIETFSEHP